MVSLNNATIFITCGVHPYVCVYMRDVTQQVSFD